MAKIESSESTHEEVDEVEENLARLGSYAAFPEVPVANSLRSVFFVAPTAQGDGSGSSAGNALAGTATVVSDNATANVRDVFVFLQGSYNPNTATGGFAISVAGVIVLGLGGDLCQVENDNASAVACFTVSANNCQISGFNIVEGTLSVEGILTSGTSTNGLIISFNYFYNAMENGVHLGATSNNYCRVYENTFYNMTNDAIEVSGTAQGTRIYQNTIVRPADTGIHLNGDTVDGAMVYENYIQGDNSYTTIGISIVLGDSNEIVNNEIWGCATSESDTGSNNIFNNKCPKKRVVHPSSGAPVSISCSGLGAETYSPWTAIVTPTAPFTVETIEVDLQHACDSYTQVGASGDTNSDVVHIHARESGTTMIATRSNPRFYPYGTTLAGRVKSRLGSGGITWVRVWTEEPD